MPAEQRFKARIVEEGSRAFLEIPFDPNAVWGEKQRHNVSGIIGGCRFRGPLEPGGSGYYLSLGPTWRRDNGIEPGQEVDAVLAPEGPQDDNMAADLVEALEAEPEAKAFFDSLATFYRRNYVRWIEGAKRPETRAKRIAEAVALLKNGVRQK